MRCLINTKTAGTILLLLLSAVLVLHLLILAGILPYEIFWGGQMNNETANMVMMESIAVVLLSVFIGITVLNTFHPLNYRVMARVGMWIIFAYLLLNTVGNLASEELIEKAVMAPVTFLMSLLSLRLAISKKS